MKWLHCRSIHFAERCFFRARSNANLRFLILTQLGGAIGIGGCPSGVYLEDSFPFLPNWASRRVHEHHYLQRLNRLLRDLAASDVIEATLSVQRLHVRVCRSDAYVEIYAMGKAHSALSSKG